MMRPMTARPDVIYAVEPGLTPDAFIDVLRRSTLAERRPVDQPTRIARMLAGADLIVTARTGDGYLIGVSRAIHDGAYCCYLSDLAVDTAFQKRGIGQALIAETHRHAGPETLLILLAAPGAATYYPHIGMEQHPNAFTLPRTA